MDAFKRFAHLTDPGGIKDKIISSHEGMAHFGGTGPAGRVCAHCQHWRFGQDRALPTAVSNAKPKQAPCALFVKATRIKSKPVPFDALACKRFELHPAMCNSRLHNYNPE